MSTIHDPLVTAGRLSDLTAQLHRSGAHRPRHPQHQFFCQVSELSRQYSDVMAPDSTECKVLVEGVGAMTPAQYEEWKSLSSVQKWWRIITGAYDAS